MAVAEVMRLLCETWCWVVMLVACFVSHELKPSIECEEGREVEEFEEGKRAK